MLMTVLIEPCAMRHWDRNENEMRRGIIVALALMLVGAFMIMGCTGKNREGARYAQLVHKQRRN